MISSNRARRGIARVASVALLISGSALVVNSTAFAGANPCNGVFVGSTPDVPIQKHADVTQAHPGDTITYTISWHSNGAASADVTDCFRVGDGNDSTLNALVEGFNVENEVTNQGGNGDPQSQVLTIVVPNDPSLIGKTIVDRAKITHGSEESRSDLVSVTITPAPCETDCPSPTPTPTVTETATPTATPVVSPTTSVKGVTLGKTGTNDAPMLWLGAFLILAGLGLTGATFRRRSMGR